MISVNALFETLIIDEGLGALDEERGKATIEILR